MAFARFGGLVALINLASFSRRKAQGRHMYWPFLMAHVLCWELK